MSDYRHDILGPNGLSTASGTFTMKSPLMGSGGGEGGPLYTTEKRVYFDVTDTLKKEHIVEEGGYEHDEWVSKPIPAGMEETIDEFFNDYQTTVQFDSLKCVFDGVEYPIQLAYCSTYYDNESNSTVDLYIYLDDGKESRYDSIYVRFTKNIQTGKYTYLFYNITEGTHQISFSKMKTVPSESFDDAAEVLKYDDEDGDFIIACATTTNRVEPAINKTYEDLCKLIGAVKKSEDSRLYTMIFPESVVKTELYVTEHYTIRGRYKVLDRNNVYYSAPCVAIPVLSTNGSIVGFYFMAPSYYVFAPNYGEDQKLTMLMHYGGNKLNWKNQWDAPYTVMNGKVPTDSYDRDAIFFRVDGTSGEPIEDESTGS